MRKDKADSSLIDLGPSDLDDSPVDAPDIEEVKPLTLPNRVSRSVSSVSGTSQLSLVKQRMDKDTKLAGGSDVGLSTEPVTSSSTLGRLTPQNLPVRLPSSVPTVSGMY